MKRIWNYISVRGKEVMATEKLLSLTALALGAFHICLLTFFLFMEMYQMLAVNVTSVVVYVFCYLAIKKGKHLLFIFNIMYVEIMIYSIVSTLLLGIDSGFMLYLIAILPLGYYIAYNFQDEEKTINPMIYVIVAVVAFWVTRVVHRFVTPPYAFDNVVVDRAVYMVNYTVIAVAIVVFCSTMLSKVNNLEEQQRIQNEILQELSKIDPLTGLVNRRSIQERYKEAEGNKEIYAVILGDIDDFKKVNDTYGHIIGDKVLKEVAGIFKQTIRSEDVVCRWGGEEILIFLPEASKEQAVAVSERILEKIRKIQIETENNHKFTITMTLGVAVSQEAESFKAIVKKADDRLYVGKKSGKNQIVSN